MFSTHRKPHTLVPTSAKNSARSFMPVAERSRAVTRRRIDRCESGKHSQALKATTSGCIETMRQVILREDKPGQVDVAVDAERVAPHLHLIGSTGSGKSSTAIHLIRHLLTGLYQRASLPVLVDPMGNLSMHLLCWMASAGYSPSCRCMRLLCIEPTREEIMLPFNPLSLESNLWPMHMVGRISPRSTGAARLPLSLRKQHRDCVILGSAHGRSGCSPIYAYYQIERTLRRTLYARGSHELPAIPRPAFCLTGSGISCNLPCAIQTTPDAIPSRLHATANGPTSVNLAWSSVSGATDYSVLRAPSLSGPWTQIYFNSPSSCTDDNLPVVQINPNTTYYYQVRGLGHSDVASATTQSGTAPHPPMNVAARDSDYTDKMQTTWTASMNASTYAVWWNMKNNRGASTKIITTDVAGSGFDDATAGTTFFYWVNARHASGISGNSVVDPGVCAAASVTIPAADTTINAHGFHLFGADEPRLLLTTPFFDDHILALVANITPGISEPDVPIYYNNVLIGGENHQLVESSDQILGQSTGFPITFIDRPSNMYVRATCQKSDGAAVARGTSVLGSPSFRESKQVDFIPTVNRVDVSIGGLQRCQGFITGQFGSLSNIISARTFPDPVLDTTAFGVDVAFTTTIDISQAIATPLPVNDRFRLLTISSMFLHSTHFGANRFEDAAGYVRSFSLTDLTPTDQYLFSAPLEIRSRFELQRTEGSVWFPDTTTAQVDITRKDRLQLEPQRFIQQSNNPNDDSLSVWREQMNAPDKIHYGATFNAGFQPLTTGPAKNYAPAALTAMTIVSARNPRSKNTFVFCLSRDRNRRPRSILNWATRGALYHCHSI